jgi:hypothetical protein
VIVPGPKGKQHPYLTSLAPALWKPRALRELYRLRWQIEAAQTQPINSRFASPSIGAFSSSVVALAQAA